MHKDKAKEKFCPLHFLKNCLADECMMWVMEGPEYPHHYVDCANQNVKHVTVNKRMIRSNVITTENHDCDCGYHERYKAYLKDESDEGSCSYNNYNRYDR